MKSLARTFLKGCEVLILGITLTACGALSPGINPGMGLRVAPTPPSSGVSAESEGLADVSLNEVTMELVQSERATRNSRAQQNLTDLIAPAVPYVIGSGDTLFIVVWDHPELNGSATSLPATGSDTRSAMTPSVGFIVDQNGQIQFPYAGTLTVAGLTQDAALTQLATKLARYINQPKVTLQIQSYRSKRIYVDGEVKQPGVHAITDIPMTLIEALNRAGGLLSSADQSRISLAREGANYTINLPQLVQDGMNPAQIMLKDGDVLRVRSRDESKVFVSGEVVAPRALVMHNGRLSLNEALGEAGGISPLSGDAGQIYIVRRSTDRPAVYRLNANAPGAMAIAEAFELHPKDVVYVAATPLTNWHRTISQLLPSPVSAAVGAVLPGR